MDSTKRVQIREALRQMAAAHAATIQQMEPAMALLAEALQIDGDVEQYSPTKESSLAGVVRIHRSLLSVEYQGKHCFLGNTLLFRLIERLATKPNKYLPYEDLLSEVWESNRSDGAVRSVVRRLRVALRSQGMDEVAEGIDGSVPGHYALKLSAEESKMQQE